MRRFWSNLFRRRADGSEVRDLLRRIPLFEALSRSELAAVERILYRREYAAGELIFRQGDPGLGMYIVEEGRVAIVFEPDRVLATLCEGDFFGEISLLNETPRSATARAETACTLWGFFQPDFLGLLERNPRLGVKVLLPLARITGRRLLRTDRQLVALYDAMEQAGEAPGERAGDGSQAKAAHDIEDDLVV